MWTLLFLLNSPKAVKQYTSETFMWKHHHHHHHHHHHYYYYHYVPIVKSTDKNPKATTRGKWNKRHKRIKSYMRQVPSFTSSGLGLKNLVLFTLLNQHLANDNVSDGQTEDNIARCMRRMLTRNENKRIPKLTSTTTTGKFVFERFVLWIQYRYTTTTVLSQEDYQYYHYFW